MSARSEPEVIDICDNLPAERKPQLAGNWLLYALHEFRHCDLLNFSATLDTAGAAIAGHFLQAVRWKLEAYAETRRLVVVAACGRVRQPRVQPSRLLPPPAGKGPGLAAPQPITDTGFPANDLYVVAVGPTDNRLFPIVERTEAKVGDLFWHMPGGTPGAPTAAHIQVARPGGKKRSAWRAATPSPGSRTNSLGGSFLVPAESCGCLVNRRLADKLWARSEAARMNLWRGDGHLVDVQAMEVGVGDAVPAHGGEPG